MAAIAVAGVGAMLCISSSVAAVMMGGGGDETPAAGAGAGAGADTPIPEPTPVLRDTPETMRHASTVWSGQPLVLDMVSGV